MKTKASTQQHLDVEDIIEDLVLLKTGWVALAMSVTAVNFDLLSEAEQDATIYAYGAFLNSLSFPIEVLVRSKKADITAYFQLLEDAKKNQANPDLKRQIQKYEDFIQSTVQQKTVLDKKFYIIINFSPLELGIKGFKGKDDSAKSKMQLILNAKAALTPKRDHIIKQTSRLGLLTRQLITQELVELFYDIYNPAPTGTQRVLLDTSTYTTPMVEAAVENPSPAPAPNPVTNSNLFANPKATVPPTREVEAQTPKIELRPIPPNPQPAYLNVQTQPNTAATRYQQPGISNQVSDNPKPQTNPPVGPTTQPSNYPTIQPTSPSSSLPNNQLDALKELQSATAKAAQLMTQPTPPPAGVPYQSNPVGNNLNNQ